MKKSFRVSLRVLALFASLSVLFYACNDDAPVAVPDPVSVSGVVLDGEGHAVPGAVLEIHDSEPSVQSVIAFDTTDDYGVFVLNDLPGKTSSLYVRVMHPSYQPFVGGLRDILHNAKNGKVELLLQNDSLCCGTVALTVTDSANAAALHGVEVKLRHGSTTVAVGATDSTGRIVFRNVCEGEYNFRVAKQGYRVVEEDIVIEECDSVGFNIVMRTPGNHGNDECCHGVATVVLRDSTTSDELGGATVKLRKNGAILTTLTTNNDGLVHFTGLCPGQYSLLIIREGYKTSEVNFTAECNDTVQIERRLLTDNHNTECCHGWIRVVVRDSTTNAVVTGAKVKIWKNNQLKGQETTGQNGAVIDGLCEGRYGVSISREGYAPIEFDIELGCNDSLEITQYIKGNNGGQECCNNKIKIIVRDSVTNQPIPNATVKLWQGGAHIATKTANGDGVVVFEELCRGTYGISVMRDTYHARELHVEVNCNSNEVRTVSLVGEHSNPDSCCNSVLKIIVRDSTTNQALASTLVKLWKGNKQQGIETTNGDGYVIFYNLCPGKYGVDLIREHYNAREFSIEIGCNDTVVITKQMLLKNNNHNDTCNTAKLKLRVKDPANGIWITGATVVIKRNGAVVAQGTTDVEGWYLKEGLLAPAEYTVTISKDGYESQTHTFKFTECKQLQETIRLEAE